MDVDQVRPQAPRGACQPHPLERAPPSRARLWQGVDDHPIPYLVPLMAGDQVNLEAGGRQRARLLMEDARIERLMDGGQDGDAGWRRR